jgi:cephalosporin hydroxylase
VSDDFAEFAAQRAEAIAAAAANPALQAQATDFIRDAGGRYSYNFDWMGLPIIQYPQDIVAIQELIWRIRPAAVVETGVARGGSLALSASILELLGGDGIVVGVDIDIRAHNRRAIESHPLARRIRLVEGSSTAPEVVDEVRSLVGNRGPVLVFLDSLHTHAHALDELRAYSPLVQPGSYVVVFDTVIDDLPAEQFADRPWGPGDNPKTAVHTFLTENDRFEIDREYDAKLLISAAPNGYLRCVR